MTVRAARATLARWLHRLARRVDDPSYVGFGDAVRRTGSPSRQRIIPGYRA